MATGGLGVLVCLFVLIGNLGANAPTAGTTISGSVVDPSLHPIAEATVTLERDSKTVATTVTDVDGKFHFDKIAAGAYHVRIVAKGWPSFARDLRVTDNPAIALPIVLGAPLDAKAAAANQGTVLAESPLVDSKKTSTDGMNVAGSAGRGGGGGRGGGTVSAMPALPSTVAAPPAPAPMALAAYGGGQYQRPDFTYDARQPWPVVPGGETYAPIEANGFQPSREHPLSTFGADVDTASYSNIRRFLNAGQLPPSDAVRIEELVNYFRFSYSEPRDGKPIALTTEIGDCPWAPSHKLVLIGAKAAAPRDREVGRNIVLLIDVSGSMQPAERLPLLKSAFGLFVDTLRPDDTVSIVTYAGTSGVALWPTRAREREVIQNAIARLSAGGSTNGGEGLVAAYRIARQAFVPGGVNRVILATDGDFNVGVTSQGDLLHLIERERDSGVFLSVFGVGTGNLKDQTMEMIADHGNGHYAYLDSLQEARRVLVREGDATLENVAKDVKFQVEFNPSAVAAWKLLGYEKRLMAARDFNNDRKDGGEMGAGHTVTVLYEVVPVGVSWGGAYDGPGERPAVDPLKYQSSSPASASLDDRRLPPASPSGEWFTVKARFKAPEGDVSDVISASARPGGGTRFLPFASTVAEFGLLLRDGPSNAAQWQRLLARIDALRVNAGDAAERDGFKELVATAAGLSRIR
jgi:Ca-activated chloride channel family protein